jgi:hypothetical protein
MAFQKKQILQKIEEKIEQYQNDIEFDLSQIMIKEQTPRFFVFFKKLFRIPHSPKYLTREEADIFLSDQDNYRFEDIADWIEFTEMKENLDFLYTMKERVNEAPNGLIELFGPEKRLLESNWRW